MLFSGWKDKSIDLSICFVSYDSIMYCYYHRNEKRYSLWCLWRNRLWRVPSKMDEENDIKRWRFTEVNTKVIEPVLEEGEQKYILYQWWGTEYVIVTSWYLSKKKKHWILFMANKFPKSMIWNHETRRHLKTEANRDGWWISESLVQQWFKDVILLFELLYFGCMAVFVSDQSSDH